jgi:hypothetical protein
MREAEFQRIVIDMAHLFGWRVAHFRPAKTARGWRTAVSADGAGFPDLVLAKNQRVLFAELKTEKGKLSDAQHEWLAALPGSACWRPSDLDSIERLLRGD